MKNNLEDYHEFYQAIQNDDLVFLFGTGTSSMLTGKQYSWWKWIVDGIDRLFDCQLSSELMSELEGDASVSNMVSVVGKVLEAAKDDGTYHSWMHESFETGKITNDNAAEALRQLLITQSVFATTNYDLLLEKATGLYSLSYENPAQAFLMLDNKQSTHVLHIHGMYDSVSGIDNIVADDKQYTDVIENQGAQFIQNILGTRTLIFVGCGKTIDDPNISRFIDFAKTHLKMHKTYYFLCKDPVDGLPDQIVQIPYGDEYSDLPLFFKDIAQARLKKRISYNPIVGRNAFSDGLSSSDALLRYHFSQRTIPFCGRDDELSKLYGFIDSDAMFSWWAITGQAGSGKSRLALELLYRLPVSWFGFFISDFLDQHDIKSFNPFCNTIVIIDYVLGRERFVASVICALRKLFSTTKYKLRILLLEREANRNTGSWYSKLMQRMSKGEGDIIKLAEYSEAFLNLVDMRRKDVEKFITSICDAQGAPGDNASELYDAYGQKYERLRFRPLYLQLFVEAWIENDYSIPQYGSYTELIESLLIREQERWTIAVDGDISVCNAMIRLMIRANISGRIELKNLPDLYKSDWDRVADYIKKHSFVGKQSEEWQASLINSFCHNIDDEHAIIAPQFPDIIKEYMFAYYTDDEWLPAMMKEVWQHCAGAFSTFIMRCMMDFPDEKFFVNSINAYKSSTTDIEVLTGRLKMLEGKDITDVTSYSAHWDIITNEYHFWSSIEISDDDSEETNLLASLKVYGLYMVAQNIGAWSLYDLTDMEEIIDELLEVKGGALTEISKKICLEKHMNELSKKGFFEEAEVIREKLGTLIKNGDKDDGIDVLFEMDLHNNQMMDAIFAGNMKEAKSVLQKMESDCDNASLYSVQALSSSAFRMVYMSFYADDAEGMELGRSISERCEVLYPDDPMLRASRIGCHAFKLQKVFLDNIISEDRLRDQIQGLDKELSQLSYDGTENDNVLEDSWSALKKLLINIASEKELRDISAEAERILNINPRCTSVVATKIKAVHALYTEHLHKVVPHIEVEKLYRYLEINPYSAVIRNNFFEMLAESEDASNRNDYLTPEIINGAISDARYNPMYYSGIPEIDYVFDDMGNDTYIRTYPKVGRNNPCPCGSGKKFKKCCIGKGIYD